MDYVGYKDVFRAEKAIRWNLPTGYWRTRINTRIFYEVGELLDQEGIDWQFLALKLENDVLSARTSRCDCLEDIVKDFHRLLNDGETHYFA